jgi:hypothetical protein
MWAIAITFRPSTFHILIFSSETTGSIATKLWWNGPWVTPFQNYVRWSRLPTKMATKLKIEKRGDEILKNLLWNYWANLNQILLKWSLGGPLPEMWPAVRPFDQDGLHSAVALLLKAALIQVSDYRLLGTSGSRIYSVFLNAVIP